MNAKTVLNTLTVVVSLLVVLLLAIGTYQKGQPLDGGWAGLLAALLLGATQGTLDGSRLKKAAQDARAALSPAPKEGDSSEPPNVPPQ